MTNIHVWTPRRYNFNGFKEVLEEHPFFQNGKLGSVQIHYHQQLTAEVVYSIFTTALIERAHKNINVLLFDDDELEDGCGLDKLLMTIRHMINVTKVHDKTFFLIADFIDFLYRDGTYTHREIIRAKREIVSLVAQYPSRNIYCDFQGLIDGIDCDAYNLPNEVGMKKLFEHFTIVLRSRAPVGAF